MLNNLHQFYLTTGKLGLHKKAFKGSIYYLPIRNDTLERKN